MAGMFGAPIGILAAEDQANKTALTQVQAQRLLGELEQIPGEIALKKAQARNADALALHHRTQAADIILKREEADAAAAEMAGWEAAARKAGQIIPATEGREATAEDVQRFRPGSLSSPLEQLYKTMVEGGAPSKLTLPLAEKIAKIKSDEATASYRSGQANNQDLESQLRVANQIGSIAKAAYDTPEGYAQMRLLASQLGKDLPPGVKQIIDGLPQDWQAGRKALGPIITRALSVKDSLELGLKEEKAEQNKLLATSTIAKNNAAVATAKVQRDLIQERTTMLKKLGGEGTPAAEAATEALTAARLQALEAKQLAMHPAVPATASKVVPGKTYTLADKSVGRAVTGADGKIEFDIIQPPLKTRMQPRTPEEIRAARKKALRITGLQVEDDEDD